MSTTVVYKRPVENEEEDDTVVKEIVIGNETFSKTYDNRVVQMADGTSLFFRLQPVDTSNTWSAFGLRLLGDITSFIYDKLPTVQGVADYNDDKGLTLSVSVKFE